MTDDEKFMKEALKQAKKAYAIDEVPIGCVIVQNGKIIARGYNRRNIDKNTLAHAELSAIRKASKKTGDWRLEDCDLYVTLEPCQMCAGAIVQSRMRRVIIGSMNPKAGCAGSVLNLLQMQQFNHRWKLPEVFLKRPVLPCFLLFSGNCASAKRNRLNLNDLRLVMHCRNDFFHQICSAHTQAGRINTRMASHIFSL